METKKEKSLDLVKWEAVLLEKESGLDIKNFKMQ